LQVSSDVEMKWWQALLPVYALSFRMRFTQPSYPGFFHQGSLSAWLRTVLGSPREEYSKYMTSDALESGHRRFAAGEEYRFTVFGMGERGKEYLGQLPAAIMTNQSEWDNAMPFRDNWQLESIEHWSSGERISNNEIPLALDAHLLEDEMAFWRQQQTICLRIQSPLRVYRSRHKEFKGELRYCRDVADLKDNMRWLIRVDDTLRKLAEDHGVSTPPRQTLSDVAADIDLFWVNASNTDNRSKKQSMSGLLGKITIQYPDLLTDESLALLVIGQYLGVGQLRVFGNGRYQLIGNDEACSFHRQPATGWLEYAMSEDNLRVAWHAIANKSENDWVEYPKSEKRADHDLDWDRHGLLARAGKLLRGEYQPPVLHGFFHEDADGGLRPLAAPPLSDRVMQRAVQQIISPTLDTMMNHCSYGYRSGRSRYQVCDLIQRLHREGYRWVFESDIRSFFDTLNWDKLRTRLYSLLSDAHTVNAIIAWMQAPVQYKGKLVERSQGLPQGSPLSPVLANLMLDDFDHDLTDAGCRLIRFADDFVIVAKTKEVAEKGGVLAEKALLDVGLELNQEKTHIVPFSDGFRFLGFMFVDGMAVECSAKRSERAGKPPPKSWLAIAEADDESKQEQPLRSTMPVTLSPYEERGQMLIFCGKPSVLFTRAGRVHVERDDECLFESPWNHLGGIVLFGRHHITTPAMLEALAHHVPIHLASSSGKYKGMIFNPHCATSGELWLAQQHLFSDDRSALQAAISIVDARIRHMRETLRRRKSPIMDQAYQSMGVSLRKVTTVDSREQLNGVEGNATRNYFEALRELVPKVYGFHGRNRRPPKDPFNALLSLGYMQLYAHVDALLRVNGLLPEHGFYHQRKSGHAALASDLMEPFRHIVERCALSMLQRQKLKPDDFTMTGDKGCRMTAAARRVYFAKLSEAFYTPVQAAGGGKPVPILDHIHHQSIAVKLWVGGKTVSFEAWRMR